LSESFAKPIKSSLKIRFLKKCIKFLIVKNMHLIGYCFVLNNNFKWQQTSWILINQWKYLPNLYTLSLQQLPKPLTYRTCQKLLNTETL
jgi:hypothetical protein